MKHDGYAKYPESVPKKKYKVGSYEALVYKTSA